MSKVLKKLTLNKEVVARISDNQMNRLWGGYGTPTPTDNFCQPTGIGGGDTCYQFCTNQCPSRICTDFCPKTDINDCPDHSQVGSGCDNETCGWAYTCNGR